MGGWQLSNRGLQIMPAEKSNCLDIQLLVGIEMIPESAHDTMEIGSVHHILGHLIKVTLQKTAVYHNIKLRGTLDTCYECSIAKAKANKENKVTTKADKTTHGEHISISISTINQQSFGGY
jgi:hypothetical protein